MFVVLLEKLESFGYYEISFKAGNAFVYMGSSTSCVKEERVHRLKIDSTP